MRYSWYLDVPKAQFLPFRVRLTQSIDEFCLRCPFYCTFDFGHGKDIFGIEHLGGIGKPLAYTNVAQEPSVLRLVAITGSPLGGLLTCIFIGHTRCRLGLEENFMLHLITD